MSEDDEPITRDELRDRLQDVVQRLNEATERLSVPEDVPVDWNTVLDNMGGSIALLDALGYAAFARWDEEDPGEPTRELFRRLAGAVVVVSCADPNHNHSGEMN